MTAEPVPTHLKVALSCAEVAVLTGLSEQAVRNLIAGGVLRRVPHTGRVLVARCEVDRWVSSGIGVPA